MPESGKPTGAEAFILTLLTGHALAIDGGFVGTYRCPVESHNFLGIRKPSMRNRCNDSSEERGHDVRTRREVLKAGAAMVAVPFLEVVTTTVQAARAPNASPGAHIRREDHTATEWLSYGGDKASSKYLPLVQISGDNFSRLKPAWTWQSAEEEVAKTNNLKTWVWESTPLMVGGVLYVSTSLSQVAALDAATGKTLWVYDPETWKNGTPSNNGFVHRGVAYWADGKDRRILFGTGDGYLICLNAQTGKLIPASVTRGALT